jgi:hypothetical protein
MRRFSIRSQCACYFMGILLSIFLPIVPSSVQDVHGASVTLAWDPNPDANLAGYKVYYGCASGSYSFMVDAGNRTSLTISGLEEGKTYYFTATAYGAAGEESGMSDEIQYDAPRPDSHFLSPTKAPEAPAGYAIQASARPSDSISPSGSIVFRRRISDKLRYDAPRPDNDILSPTKTSNGTVGYTITASAGPNGSISAAGNIAVRRGSSMKIIITPNRGYRIGRVNVDGVSMNHVTSHTFTHINANHTIRAEFEPIPSKKERQMNQRMIP